MSAFMKKQNQSSKDIDHLVNFNKNGLWIKEELIGKKRIICRTPEGYNLINLKIFHFNQNSSLLEKICADKAFIKDNTWLLTNVKVFKLEDDTLKKKYFENYQIDSVYNYEKINNLFKNFDTLSFIKLLTKKNDLKKNGYSELFYESLRNAFYSLFLFL